MQFNKLYNLILESIINLNKITRAALLEKYNVPNRKAILFFLDKLNNNKLAELLAKFFANGQLLETTDFRIEQVKEILNKVNSIDINLVKDLDLFIHTYLKIINAKEDKESIKDLDSIKEFSLKKLYPYGVVVYRVADTKEAQKVVRKIVDVQWGYDANPWCIITRKTGLDAWNYWKRYNAYPKHIAFQNGKLLAFCANDEQKNIWWDRLDNKCNNLPLDDYNNLEVLQFKWSNELKIKNYFKVNGYKLKYNLQTKRYDCDGDLWVLDEDLVDGHFPIPFGEIRGDFDCSYCWELTSLLNGPTLVDGTYYANSCKELLSLLYSPKYVGEDYDIRYCDALKSLKGITPKIKGYLYCQSCLYLLSLLGVQEVGGIIKCGKCPNLNVTKLINDKYIISVA